MPTLDADATFASQNRDYAARGLTELHFADVSEMHAFASKIERRHISRGSYSFFGPEYKQSLAMLLTGDATLVSEAQSIMSQIEDTMPLSNGIPLQQPSIIGYVPHIPNAIAGLPKSMLAWCEDEQPSNRAPISIYYDVGVSAGVTHRQLMRRGVAALALVMSLQMTRPVNLTICAGYNQSGKSRGISKIGEVVTCRVSSTPIDLATACHLMTSPTVCRRIMFAITHKMCGLSHTDNTPWLLNATPNDATYIRTMREICRMSPDDIFIQGGHLTDSLMLRDPVAWVNEQMRRIDGLDD